MPTVLPTEKSTLTIDINKLLEDTKQPFVVWEKKLVVSETLDHIFLLDPLKDAIIQLNAAGQAYFLKTTSHPGEGITDITDVGVPWITLKLAGTVADYHSGGALGNRGILAIHVKADAVLTDDFHVFVKQYNLDERGA